MKEKKQYLSNKEFLSEIGKYHLINKMSKRLHEMFYLLSERIARKALFHKRVRQQNIKSTDLEDVYLDFIHEGYLKCVMKVDCFKMTCNNPFAYFTSVITNTYKDFFHHEYRQEILKMIAQNQYEHRFLIKYGCKLQTYSEENDK
jgi:hypothetical protein